MPSAALVGRCSTLVCAVLAAFVTCDVHADVVGLHVASIHSKHGFCNLNLGAYYRFEAGWQAGGYRNSECRASFYVGWHAETSGRVRAGIGLGAVTGYRGQGVQPVVMPSVAFSITEQQSVRLIFLPKRDPKSAAVLHMTLEHQL
jgi:hypothetical protein